MDYSKSKARLYQVLEVDRIAVMECMEYDCQADQWIFSLT